MSFGALLPRSVTHVSPDSAMTVAGCLLLLRMCVRLLLPDCLDCRHNQSRAAESRRGGESCDHSACRGSRTSAGQG